MMVDKYVLSSTCSFGAFVCLDWIPCGGGKLENQVSLLSFNIAFIHNSNPHYHILSQSSELFKTRRIFVIKYWTTWKVQTEPPIIVKFLGTYPTRWQRLLIEKNVDYREIRSDPRCGLSAARNLGDQVRPIQVEGRYHVSRLLRPQGHHIQTKAASTSLKASMGLQKHRYRTTRCGQLHHVFVFLLDSLTFSG